MGLDAEGSELLSPALTESLFPGLPPTVHFLMADEDCECQHKQCPRICMSTYVCMYTCIHTCTTVLYVCVCLRTYVLTYILFVLMCALSAAVLQFKLLTSISSFMDYWYAPPAPDAFVIVLGKCV